MCGGSQPSGLQTTLDAPWARWYFLLQNISWSWMFPCFRRSWILSSTVCQVWFSAPHSQTIPDFTFSRGKIEENYYICRSQYIYISPRWQTFPISWKRRKKDGLSRGSRMLTNLGAGRSSISDYIFHWLMLNGLSFSFNINKVSTYCCQMEVNFQTVSKKTGWIWLLVKSVK